MMTALLPACLPGGVVRQWPIGVVERAPVLLVGRVESVRKEFRVSDGSMAWKAETWAMTAEVNVLRSYSQMHSNLPTTGQTINVRFFAYGPSVTFFINGTPPPLATIGVHQALILPLSAKEQPTSQPWRLLSVEGLSLTIPTRAELAGQSPPPKTGREFILRELANSLSHGTPEEMSEAGGYVHEQAENLEPELMPALERNIDGDMRRWAAVLVNLMGANRPNIEDLQAGAWRDGNWNPSLDHGYSAAALILKKLAISPQSNVLLVDALLARVPFAPEYAGWLAEEYAEDEYFSRSLRAALSKGQAGSIYLASTLIDNGHPAFLRDARLSAQQLKATAAGDNFTHAQFLDRDAAARLLRQ